MKFLTILIVLLLPVCAFGQMDILATAADTGYSIYGDASIGYLTASAASCDSISDWGFSSYVISDKKHDTLKEYIKEIKNIRDTVWGHKWTPYRVIDEVQYFKKMTKIDSVHCHTDTTWANKMLFYLTPDEVIKLKEILKD